MADGTALPFLSSNELFSVNFGKALSGLPRGSPNSTTSGNITLPALVKLSASLRSVLSAISASLSSAPNCASSGDATTAGWATASTTAAPVAPAAAAGAGVASGGPGTVLPYISNNLFTYPRPGSCCGSKKNTVLPITLTLAPASMSVILAWISRLQGQRPILLML